MCWKQRSILPIPIEVRGSFKLFGLLEWHCLDLAHWNCKETPLFPACLTLPDPPFEADPPFEPDPPFEANPSHDLNRGTRVRAAYNFQHML